jgi:hypothetical protein
VPAGAVVRCAGPDDCPASLLCLEDVRRCVPRDSPCIAGGGNAVADGQGCGGEDICVQGLCGPSICGDGYVDVAVDEACEPGAGACRDDCTIPVCGDGILDPGETCETGDDDCAACVHACRGTYGDCDLDPATGCECDLVDVAQGTIAVFAAEEAAGGVWALDVTSIAGPDASLRLLFAPTDGSGALVVDDDLAFGGAFAQHDGVLYAALTRRTGAGYEARIERITSVDDRVVLRRETAINLDSLAVDDESLYVSTGVGLFPLDRETAAGDEALTDRCVKITALQACGDEVVCFEVPDATASEDFTSLPGELLAVDKITGDARVVDTGTRLTFGCDESGRILWRNGGVLFRESEPGTRQAVAALPSQNDGLVFVNEKVFEDDGDLFVSIDLRVHVVRPSLGMVAAIADGHLLSVSPTHIVVSSTTGDAVRALPR